MYLREMERYYQLVIMVLCSVPRSKYITSVFLKIRLSKVMFWNTIPPQFIHNIDRSLLMVNLIESEISAPKKNLTMSKQVSLVSS